MAAGACAAGFAALGPVDDDSREMYSRWLAAGRNAGMDYMERYCDVRDNPGLLLEGARTIMCVAFAYRTPDSPRHPLFADYALGRDYHEVLRKRLAPVAAMMEESVPGSKTRICVDTAPLRERYWAARAGVGNIAKNNFLIVPGVGAAVFLAEILWTAAVRPSESMLGRSCSDCGACRKACPGGALGADGQIDASRCLSYLTIEHRGELPERLDLAGKRIYGCDICRDVCPECRAADVFVPEEFLPSAELLSLDIDAVRAMEQPEFSRIFSHSAVKRAKLAGLRRNALRRPL